MITPSRSRAGPRVFGRSLPVAGESPRYEFAVGDGFAQLGRTLCALGALKRNARSASTFTLDRDRRYAPRGRKYEAHSCGCKARALVRSLSFARPRKRCE